MTKKLTKAEPSYNFHRSYSFWWYFRRGLKGKTLWNWLDLLIAPAIISLIAVGLTVGWSLFDRQQASKLEATRYHQRLVREYINSVKVLLLDEYHHEEYKKPEILPKDVENFIKSKTATTIKALKDSPEQRKRLIDFLRRVEVGFAPLLNRDFQIMPQDICDQKVTTKTKEYSHFLCGINLDKANLNESQLDHSIFQYAKFREVSFKKANLDSSHLQHAFLQEAHLQNTSLQNSDLAGAKLKDAKLKDAKLKDAKLKDADLKGVNLRGADLTRANLGGADLKDADLTGADLTKANLRGAKLDHVKFDSQTKLEGSLFNSSTFDPSNQNQLPFDKEKAKTEYGMLEIVPSANLTGADLTGADLTGVDLTKANLRGANLKGIRFDRQTKLEDALFDLSTQLPFDKEKAKTEYGMLEIAPGADLRSADLTGADLTKADLTKADLRGAKLDHVKFDSQTKLEGALFDSSTFDPSNQNQLPFDKEKAKTEYGMLEIASGADLAVADLTGADLAVADLTGANLTDADLTGANLTDADLTGANLTDADLTGANLTDANFTNVTVTNAQLASAKLCRTTFKHKDNDNEKILGKYCELYLIPSKSMFSPRQSMTP